MIDKKSLLRQIKIRMRWHKDLTIEEVIEIIREAPEIEGGEDEDREI